LIDLETEIKLTLLEFDPLLIPTEAYSTPRLHWDKTSSYITNTIPPQHIYSPWEYSGEPEQIWRLHVSGEADLLAEVEPLVGIPSVVKISPFGDYYFYFEGEECLDGGMLTSHLRILPSGEESLEIPCAFFTPEWTPDGENFHYKLDGEWILGNINDPSTHDLGFVNLPAAENIWPKNKLFWIDNSTFLLKNHGPEGCNLFLGTVDGILVNLYKSPSDQCPSVDYSISNR
jgi:hypothetical protein